jgi:hypothetical protein
MIASIFKKHPNFALLRNKPHGQQQCNLGVIKFTEKTYWISIKVIMPNIVHGCDAYKVPIDPTRSDMSKDALNE